MRKQVQRLENLPSHSASHVKLVNWKPGHEAPPSILPACGPAPGQYAPWAYAGSSSWLLSADSSEAQAHHWQLKRHVHVSRPKWTLPKAKNWWQNICSLLRFRVPRGDCISVKGHGGSVWNGVGGDVWMNGNAAATKFREHPLGGNRLVFSLTFELFPYLKKGKTTMWTA